MKKRILGILLVLTMVVSLVVVPNSVAAGSHFDTVDTDCELAVDVVTALGIMGGYTDGSFLPYNTITRAEMASVAVNLANIEGFPETAPDDMDLFNDMYDYEDWAGGVVAVAKSAGIAKADEDGNFNPDMSATFEDAVQMIVSAIGYGHQAMSRGGKAEDYVYIANRLGITDDVTITFGENITRGDVAKLVYAALTVDLMLPVSYSGDGTMVEYQSVEGVNALNKYFDAYEVSGIITENEYAAIDGETTVEEEQVLINDEVFNVGSTDIASYLGYYATVYALEADDADTNREIIAYSIKSVKNNSMTLNAEDIDEVVSDVDGYTYKYWVDGGSKNKPRKVETSATPYVLYNGKSIMDVTENDLVPDNGYVVFIDNNGDDKYDIIDIWEYELAYVFTTSQTTGNVTSYYDRATPFKLDPESEDYHVTFLDANGGIARFSDIKQYSVLYVYQSKDYTEKKVVIANNKITGTIEEIDSEGIYTINGNGYEISPAAESKIELAISDTGSFYLDADMRIVGFEGTTVIRKNIGMFIAVNDGGLRDGYQMKVLTQNGGVQIFNIASTVKVNGDRLTAEEIYDWAFSDLLFGRSPDKKYEDNNIWRPDPARAAFLYKLNSKGEICDITVVGEGEGDGYLQTRQIKTKGQLYYSANYKCLHFSQETTKDEYGNTVGVRTYCDDKTVNFLSEEAVRHTDDNKSFYTKYMNSYWDNYNFDLYDYCWAYYYSPDGEKLDMQKTVCSFLVMANQYDVSVDSTEDAQQLDDARNYQDNTPPKFIEKITKAYDRASGEETLKVYFFDGTNRRSALIRPQYQWVAYWDYELYPNGFPVRIAMEGAYIEDMAPYFDENPLPTYAKMWTASQRIDNATTGNKVMPIQPFSQEQHRKWNYWSGSAYYTRFYTGVITSIDEVVGRKLFNLAYATSGSDTDGDKLPDSYAVKMLTNERLEGTVYKLNFDGEGQLEKITKGSLDDITPGQFVIVRKRAWDASPKWEALTGYAIHEFYIISDDIEELDYLDGFYEDVQEEIAKR